MISNMRKVDTYRFRASLISILSIASLVMLPDVNATGVVFGHVIGYTVGYQLVMLPKAKVTVYSSGSVVQSVSPGFDGVYTVSLPPGLYVVTAEYPGFNVQSRVVQIFDGRSSHQDFYLEFTTAVKGNAFDFSLASSGSITIPAGESGWTTIKVTLLSGPAQNVSLSVSGLPSGATFSLTPRTVNATCTSVCIVGSSAAVPAGTYTVTLTANGGGITRSASFTLTVTSRAFSPNLP